MKSNWIQQIPSQESYWMNRVLFDVHHDESRLARYLENPEAYLDSIPLALEMKKAIRDNDIATMYRAGVNPYLLRAHCLGLRIPESVFLESLQSVATGGKNG
jgi:Aromatic-ring-opening dioxygenase LigAB, LigA subunit